MAKVTEKNTKKEILEALKEAEAKLAERREANTTTADVVRAKEVETAELRSKLDNAYTRIQEMAIEQSKASTPRLVETTK